MVMNAMKKQLVWLLVVMCGLVGCTAVAAGTAVSADANTAVLPTPLPTPIVKPMTPPVYGMVYVYEQSSWSEANRDDIGAQLADMKAMGINTVVQTFSSGLIAQEREQDWLIFLDEAERIEISVVARLWPLADTDADWPLIARFMEVVGDHPALAAYLGLHEPLERFTSDEMRAYYAQFKEAAPHVPLAHYMGSMALFDGSVRFPGRDFSAGICDLCIVWCTPAQTHDGEPTFDAAELIETVAANRQLIDERDPAAQLWFLGQTYALAAHRDGLRMPTPAEMEEMYLLATQAGSDGFLWYPWLHGSYDAVLSDPEMTAQQTAVFDIYRRHAAPIGYP